MDHHPRRTVAVLLFDVVVIACNLHEPTTPGVRDRAFRIRRPGCRFRRLAVESHSRQFALEFYAGWLTEYSLSIDNLFIFIIIMASFMVPKMYQQQAPMVGIILALIFRGVFIASGAVAIERFS